MKRLPYVLFVSCLIWAALCPGMAKADDLFVLRGQCTAGSYISSGRVGTNLSKSRSRVYCDSMVLEVFDDVPGHVMFQFSTRGAPHVTALGYAGYASRNNIETERVYYELGGASTPANPGSKCRATVIHGDLTHITCTARTDEGGWRTESTVDFSVRPGQ
jgi:hypothetical protein